MGVSASVLGEGNREFLETELKSTQKDDEALLSGLGNLNDSEFLISLKGLDKYNVPGGVSHQKASGKVRLREQAAVLTQRTESLHEKHQELLDALQTDIRFLRSRESDLGQLEITRKLQSICLVYDAVLRTEAREVKRLKAQEHRDKPKRKGKHLPPIAQVGLRFGIESLLCLISRVGDTNPLVYKDIMRISTSVLSSLPPMSLQVDDPAMAQCIDSVSSFFERILNGEVSVLTERDQMSVLSPLLGLALAKGNLSAALSVASKFMSLPPQVHFEETAVMMLETLHSLGRLETVTKSKVVMNWTQEKLGPDIVLSEENLTVTRTNSSSWGCQLSEQSLTQGLHYFEFKVKTNSSTCLLLGLANRNFNEHGAKASGGNCWTIQADGDTYMNGSSAGNVFRYNQGDRVGVYVNMDEHTLTFFLNGKKQAKPAFLNIPDEVFLLVCFGGSNQFVSIINDPELPDEVEESFGEVKASVRSAEEEHKRPEAEEEMKEGEEVCLFPTTSHDILRSSKFSAIMSEEVMDTSELAAVTPQLISVYLLACLDKLNDPLMKFFGLNEEPTWIPVKGKLETQKGLAISVQESVFSYLNAVLMKCAEALALQEWEQTDYQMVVWGALTTQRLLRTHLFIVKSLQLTNAQSGLSEELKSSLYSTLRLLLKTQVTHFGSANPTKEDLDALESVRREATLTLIHCFEIFCSAQNGELDFLIDILSTESSSHPVELKLQRQLIAKMSVTVNLAPVFSLTEHAVPKIKHFTSLLISKCKEACFMKLRGEDTTDEVMTLLSTVTHVLLTKLAKLPKSGFTTDLYTGFVQEVLHSCLEVLQELQNAPDQQAAKARLKSTMVDSVCTTVLLSVSLAKPDLHLVTNIIDQLQHFLEILNQIESEKAVVSKTTQLITEVYESEHPYPNSAALTHTVRVPGATRYTLKFDSQCKTESNYDFLELWTDHTKTQKLHRWEGADFAGRSFEINNPLLYFTFTSDGSTNFWGWKVTIESEIEMAYLGVNWLDHLRNSCNFVVIQLSKQLITGDFPELIETDSLTSFWANPLIKYGIKDRVQPMLGSDPHLHEGLLKLACHYQRPEALSLRKSRSAIEFAEGQAPASAISRVLNSYISSFEENSRQTYNYSENPAFEELITGTPRAKAAWKDLKRRADLVGPQFTIGGEELEAAERAVFAVYCAFFELGEFLHHYFDNPQDIGSTLRFMVREANSVRKTAQLLKQQQLDAGKEADYATVSSEIISKCIVLLNSEYKQAASQLGINKVLSNLLTLSRSQDQPALQPISKWSSVQRAVGSMSRLKTLLKLTVSHEKDDQNDEVKEFMRVARLVTEVLSSQVQADALTKSQAHRRDRALARSIGLCNLSTAFKSTNLPSAKEQLQLQVAQAFSDSFCNADKDVKQHYSSNLQGVDHDLFRAVQSAFFVLYQMLLDRLNVTQVAQTDCTSEQVSQSILTTYEALAFPFEQVDSHVLLDLNLVNPLRFLLSWAQGEGIVETVPKRFLKEKVITELTVHNESEFDQSKEGFSLHIINRLSEGDFDDGLGQHPKLCLGVHRGTLKDPVTDFVISQEPLEDYEVIGNVNEMGGELKLSVHRSDKADRFLVGLHVVGYNPIQLEGTYAVEADLLGADVSEEERDKRSKRREYMKKGAWALYRLLFYSCAGKPESQTGGALESKKARLQEAFTELAFEYLQWKPSKSNNSSSLALGKVSSGQLWQDETEVILQRKGNMISGFVCSLRKSLEEVRSEDNTDLIDEFFAGIDRYFAAFDPSMKGLIPRDSLTEAQLEQCGSDLLEICDQAGQLDFFRFLDVMLAEGSEFEYLRRLLGQAYLPTDFQDAKAYYSDRDISSTLELLIKDINPADNSFIPYLVLFKTSHAEGRPGIVLKTLCSPSVPPAFLNRDSELDLYTALHAIHDNSTEFESYWAEIKSVVKVEQLPSSAASLYITTEKEQELQATLLWTLLQSSGSQSYLKVLSRPYYLSELTQHMLFSSNIRVNAIASRIVRMILISQHSPQSFNSIWCTLPQPEAVASPSFFTVLLRLIGKPSFNLVHLSDEDQRRRDLRLCYESKETFKLLLTSERWRCEALKVLMTSVAQYQTALELGQDLGASLECAGALNLLASCFVKDELSEPLEWTRVSLKGAGLSSGILVRVNSADDTLKVFSPQDDCMHIEGLRNYGGQLPETSLHFSSLLSEEEFRGLFDTLRTVTQLLEVACGRDTRCSILATTAVRAVWREQRQAAFNICAAMVGEDLKLDSLTVSSLLTVLLQSLPDCRVTQESAKQRYKVLHKLVHQRTSNAKEQPGEEVTLARSLVRLKKSDDAELRAVDSSNSASISQLENGVILVKSLVNDSRKAALVKLKPASLRSFTSFTQEVTVLASVGLVAPCTQGVFGLLLGDIEVKVEVLADAAIVTVEGVELKRGPVETQYLFRVIAKWDKDVVVQDYSDRRRQVVLTSRSLYDGNSFAEMGVFLDRGSAVALSGLAVCEGRFIGLMNFAETVPSLPLQSSAQHYIRIDRPAVNLTQQRLGVTGAPPGEIARVLASDSCFETALQTLLSQGTVWSDEISADFHGPIELSLINSHAELDSTCSLVPLYEGGVQVGTSADLPGRRLLVFSPLASGRPAVTALSINENAGMTEVGEWSAPFAGDADFSNKLYVRQCELKKLGRKRPLTRVILVSCNSLDELSIPPGFEVVSSDGGAVNVALKGTKFVFLAVCFSSLVNGVSVDRLSQSEKSESQSGLVDSLISQSKELERERQELQDELRSYDKGSIVELHSTLMSQEEALAAAAQKDFLTRLLSSYPDKLNELATHHSHLFSKLLIVLSDNLKSLEQPVKAALSTDHVLADVLWQETILQLILEVTEVSGNATKHAPVVVESAHPYTNNMNLDETYSFPGAVRLIVEFDPQCKTEARYDILRFYTEPGHSHGVFEQSGAQNWNTVEVEGDTLYVHFVSDGSNVEWGYKFTITPVYKTSENRTDPLHRRRNLEAALWILESIVLSYETLPPALLRFTQREVLNPLFTLMLAKSSHQARALRVMKLLLQHAPVSAYNQNLVSVIAKEASLLFSVELASTSKSATLQQLSSLLVELKDRYTIGLADPWFNELSDAYDLMKGIVTRDHHLEPVLFEQFKAANRIAIDRTRMSSQPYARRPQTSEVLIEGANLLEVEFDEASKMDAGDTVLFSRDPECTDIIITGGSSHSDARWAADPKGPDVAFSNDNLTVTRTSSTSWGNAIWSTAYSSGKTRITLHIDNHDGSNYLYIGVWRVVANYSMSECVSSTCSNPAWMWKVTGEAHSPGQNYNNETLKFATGDTIAFLLDMDQRKLSLIKGQNVVHTFSDIADNVIPVICFGGSNQLVSVVSVENESASSEKLSKRRFSLEGERFFYHYPVNYGCLLVNSHTWATKHNQIGVSADKRTARRTEGTSRLAAISAVEFSAGRHYVEVQVRRSGDSTARMQVGFVPAAFTPNVSLLTAASIAYQQDGSIGFNETQLVAAGFAEGDLIGAYLDMRSSQAAFFKNGEEVARGAIQLNAPNYAFAVSFNGAQQEVAFNQTEPPACLDLIGLRTVDAEETKYSEGGFVFKVTPKFYGANKMLAVRTLSERHQEMWTQYAEEQSKALSRTVLEQVVAYVDEVSLNQNKDPLTIDPNDLNPRPEDLMHNPALEKLGLKEIQESFRMIKYFNASIIKLLPLISLDFSQLDSMQRLFLQVRSLIFVKLKNGLFKDVIGKTNTDARPEFPLDRTKSLRARETGRVDSEGMFSIFGQIFRNMNHRTFNELRNAERPYRVNFRGEGSIDAGGPYNEAVSSIADELQSSMLPLFVPVQNQVHAIGENRDSWTVNPAATAEIHQSMYLFLGKLMGVAIRTKNNLNFSFPPLFWKRLMMEEVTVDDLKATDECCYQMLDILRNLEANGITPENFSDTFDGETMTTKDAAGNSVAVIEGGELVPLTYQRAGEYAGLVESLRLRENEEAFRQMRRGMSAVIPINLLNLFSWKQVETMVCGAADVNVDILKSNTEYSSVDHNAPHVLMFWEVLREFTPKERSLLLRFVWGRSRLPAGTEFRKFKLAAMHPGGSPDNYLPVAHTCFFTLDLPAYSSKTVMRDKLLYAITHCQAIDLDRMAEGGWDED
jgi:hypothetical protein